MFLQWTPVTRRAAAAVAVLSAATYLAVAQLDAEAVARPEGALGVYTGTLDSAELDTLRDAGLDPHEIDQAPQPSGDVEVEVVLGHDRARQLVETGVPLTAKQASAAGAPEVFRPYAGPDGLRDELAGLAAAYPRIVSLQTIGRSARGVEIQAVKITRDARETRDGSRPAVLYLGAQHGREWITPEMNRRLIRHVLAGYGTDAALTSLVDTTELWFVPVANPDGYDYTFTPGNRLWRKNLRDNDGDGRISENDGVDLNRNFAEKWGYDNEGSSDNPAAETYRGPAPQSEPETAALDGLLTRIGFEFLVNYHSAAQLLLYGNGWQVGTPSPDDQIAVALAGDDAHPAIPGYDPGLSAELYTANGDTNVHAQTRTGAIGFAPEMSSCGTAAESVADDRWEADDCPSEFEFPDGERLVQDEFLRNLPFALAVARSAANPAGRAPALVADPFPVSYGETQQVAVTARRDLPGLQLHVTVNGGTERALPVAEWRGGERYGRGADRYYAEFRGTVPGQRPGDRVTVRFADEGGHVTEPFTYTVHEDIGGDVLVLAAEDVTGVAPDNTDGATTARYADTHVDALRNAGFSADVYDVDAYGGRAPHPLGVLSHYRAVVWETGDDIVPQVAGQHFTATTREAVRTERAVRDYLNEGGRLVFAGQYAGYAYRTDLGQFYRPEGPGECLSFDDPSCQAAGNDFAQYWLGAAEYIENGAAAQLGGKTGAFAGFTAEPGDQAHSSSFVSLSSVLPRETFPWFDSAAAIKWQPGGRPADAPYTGEFALFSGRADNSYKRLGTTLDVPAGARLRFRTSFDTEAEFDHLIVEAHVAGTDDWTTLPDTGGLTRPDLVECDAAGHPFLSHYRTGCEPSGTTGTWNAASGDSGGWRDFDADLSAYAGRQVEIAVSYVSDGAYQARGVLLDDLRVEAGGAVLAGTSFEDGLGGWSVAGPPDGSPVPAGDWTRTRESFTIGAGLVTDSTVLLGFGLERLAAPDREDLLARAFRHLKVTAGRGAAR
ncbi:M14 family zinc carboxypeptidase [Catenuloplanes sp. NPDC051500]|uniref:M14 family metallopeptidase n=1 Tax=Catenuloplanes sp. NPDC051500 TaxID=3363959 RepID=UPI00379D6F6E